MPKKPFLILSCLLLLTIAFLPDNALDLRRRKFIEDLCLIRAVGVDVDRDGRFVLTVCAPSPSTEEASTIVYTATGNTPAEAEKALQTFAGYDIFWGHLDFLVLGHSALEVGISPIVEFFLFKPEISFNLTVYALENAEASRVLVQEKEQQPVFERLATLSRVTEVGSPNSIFTILDTATSIYQNQAPQLPFLSFFIPSDGGDYAPGGTLRYTQTAFLPVQKPLGTRASPFSHTLSISSLGLFFAFLGAITFFSARHLKKNKLKKEALLSFFLTAGGVLFTVWGAFHRQAAGPIEWLLELLALNPGPV
ncbi:MAG: hypothetical protein IKD06_04840 [Clostridia bacterium]|nr:hypothetical protein [Clostridia bacterium]